jgi:hypothetical protein
MVRRNFDFFLDEDIYENLEQVLAPQHSSHGSVDTRDVGRGSSNPSKADEAFRFQARSSSSRGGLASSQFNLDAFIPNKNPG